MVGFLNLMDSHRNGVDSYLAFLILKLASLFYILCPFCEISDCAYMFYYAIRTLTH